MEKCFTVSIHGQRAVDAAYRFQAGNCYRGIFEHGKMIGQLEVVIDDDGSYGGLPNKWVDVSWIKSGSDVLKVLSALAKLGFSGCPCTIDEDTTEGCISHLETLCCCVI